MQRCAASLRNRVIILQSRQGAESNEEAGAQRGKGLQEEGQAGLEVCVPVSRKASQVQQ